MTDQNQLMREALESYEHAIANGHREHDALSAFDGISVPDLVRRLLALTHPQEPARVGGVPDIDYEALINAAFAADKRWAQGTYGCIAFARGAEWYRDQVLTAAPQAPDDVVRDAERYRWLRQSPIANNVALACHFGGSRMQDFDAAIDTAMSTKAGGV